MKSIRNTQPWQSADTDGASRISRRQIIRGAAAGGLLLVLPWNDVAYALLGGAPKGTPPIIPFKASRTGEGIIGPYGEARIFTVGSEILPIYIAASNGMAVMDMTLRSPFIRYGSGTSAVTITSAGIQFGADRVIGWSADTVRRLIEALSRDRTKARAALMLRSALHTSYPVAVAKSKPTNRKGKIGVAMARGAKGLGASSMNCSTTTITETITRTVTETVQVIRTAEQQYQECYDRQITRDPCRSLPFGQGACAAGICAVAAFIDIVVGFVEVVTTITEEVTRQVVSCVKPERFLWASPWAVPQTPFKDGFSLPGVQFTQATIDEAVAFLRTNGDFLGPFARCLANGQWSLAELPTPLDFGDVKPTIPYGVKVCIDAACAQTLSIEGVTSELASSYERLVSSLMALSPQAAVALAFLSFTPNAVLGGLVVVLSEAALIIVAVILGFIILALIYGVAIATQISLHRQFTNNLDDNRICIEHPTFALPLLKMLALGFAPTELIPPVVTG